MNDVLEYLSSHPDLHQSSEILGRASVAPLKAGVYAWYFRTVPDGVPTSDCLVRDGATLLYVGIAPSVSSSSATLRSRLVQHLRGNASGSTLRLSLGCLLSEQLRIELRRTKSGKRRTFGPGEALLTDWIAANARIALRTSSKPWQIEREIVSSLSLPLNLQFNETHRFYNHLSQLRRTCRTNALNIPCWSK